MDRERLPRRTRQSSNLKLDMATIDAPDALASYQTHLPSMPGESYAYLKGVRSSYVKSRDYIGTLGAVANPNPN